MRVTRIDSVLPKFAVECFDNRDLASERICRLRFEFDTIDQAIECARRIVDASLKQTRDRASTAFEWYRHWAAYGSSVRAPGTGFDARTYAKRQIRSVIGPESEWCSAAGANGIATSVAVT